MLARCPLQCGAAGRHVTRPLSLVCLSQRVLERLDVQAQFYLTPPR